MAFFPLLFAINYVFVLLGLGSENYYPPPLRHEEETELFRRARAGDEDARRRLIEHNLRLVAHIIKKYYCASKNQE
ncbi:MAG: RNA polymerase subunit sigma-70, partial [Clostridia bacterium]|nr:RNA polymerase subunit sigma-70 [Clostridia bacterium]